MDYKEVMERMNSGKLFYFAGEELSARQTACVFQVLFRIAADHVGRRRPGRPFGLATDIGIAGQRQAGATDADAVTHGAATAHDIVETTGGRIDRHH